jgi:translation initiation factor IF-3
MMFRGREIAYTELGKKLMEDIKEALVDGAVIEQQPRLEGRNMIMILAPKK